MTSFIRQIAPDEVFDESVEPNERRKRTSQSRTRGSSRIRRTTLSLRSRVPFGSFANPKGSTRATRGGKRVSTASSGSHRKEVSGVRRTGLRIGKGELCRFVPQHDTAALHNRGAARFSTARAPGRARWRRGRRRRLPLAWSSRSKCGGPKCDGDKPFAQRAAYRWSHCC